MADERHATSRRLLFDNFTRSTLCADEHDLVFVFSQSVNKLKRIIKCGDGVLQIDDVDLVACTKDVLIHLWIPKTGLVAKVRAGLQQIAHAYLCHNSSLSWV